MNRIGVKELLRKSIHVSSILIPLIYRYFIGYNRKLAMLFLIPLALGFIIVDTIRIEHRTFKKFYRNFFGIILRKHELSDFTGALYVLVSAVLCIALFPHNIAFMALSFLAIGDTLAAVVGLAYGKRKLPGSNKSVEGSLGCFIGIFIYGFLFYVLDPGLDIAMGAIAIGALAATFAEMWKLPLDDNLKIPLVSGIAMYFANQIMI